MDLNHDTRKKERSQRFFSKNPTKVSCLSYWNISEQEECLLGSFGLLVILFL